MVAISASPEVTVGKGFYWNFMTGQSVRLERPGVLPAEQRKSFLRLPLPLLLMGGPVLGLLFVMFLPVMAIAMVTTAPIQALRRRARARAATLLSPAPAAKLSPAGQRID